VYLENMDNDIWIQKQSGTKGWEEGTRLNGMNDKVEQWLKMQNLR
jgi:hypothetical protein